MLTFSSDILQLAHNRFDEIVGALEFRVQNKLILLDVFELQTESLFYQTQRKENGTVRADKTPLSTFRSKTKRRIRFLDALLCRLLRSPFMARCIF